MASADGVEKLEDAVVRSAEQVAGQIRAAKEAISTVIFGQERVIENTLVTILSGGHALLIGVPGLAKTKLVETLGITLGLDAKRIQFTPDLMPSDILGAEVLDESNSGKRSFRFISGPVFAQLLMADEINRASPRTQSALLQAMQEQHITVAGARHDLPKPFHVLATQNPLEQEGTYPLPELSSSTSEPMMSEGIRSGVNWMRLASSPSVIPRVSTSLVLARPGTPIRSA